MIENKTKTLSEWTARFEQIARKELGDDESHDLFHFRRVFSLSITIAEKEHDVADRLVLLAAAYLHDIINPPKNSELRSKASALSADRAGEILYEERFPKEKISAVQHAIETHSFSAGIEPKTLEAKIIQDADRIESLGAIGLARTFYIAGRLGSRLFDPADLLADRRTLDDSKYAVDHFQTKLLKLPQLMKTAEGKRLATERAVILKTYMNQLIDELAISQINFPDARRQN